MCAEQLGTLNMPLKAHTGAESSASTSPRPIDVEARPTRSRTLRSVADGPTAGPSESALMQVRRRSRRAFGRHDVARDNLSHSMNKVAGVVSALPTHRRCNSSSPRQSDGANGAEERLVSHAGYPWQSERI